MYGFSAVTVFIPKIRFILSRDTAQKREKADVLRKNPSGIDKNNDKMSCVSILGVYEKMAE